MLRNLSMRLFLAVLLITGGYDLAAAQNDPIEGFWFNEEKSAKVHIYKGHDNRFYGKVAWLKVPTRDGKPKVDAHNPDPNKRSSPIVGLVILKGFEKDGSNAYEEGTIYDPKSGKTYSCKMTLDGTTLDVRGFIGFSMIGRSTRWFRAD
ncbi:DUF2147 domain-containing protein [Polluticoccus soli]|uniref:DUF2147 domain-containing protein n=1 Tax=Polluticoccus soli TaxID=3034150 RepID=UPI0023E0BDE7|nr:DUF2147 domain-containing protein [Flavipsychrobacter sp. JY13-12]